MMGRIRIGQILKERGFIDDAQLLGALALQRNWGGPLGEVLLRLGFVREDELLSALSQQCGAPVVHLGDRVVAADVLRLVPEKLVRRHRVIPLMVLTRTMRRLLVLATSTPSDLFLLDEVAFAAGMPVVPVLASGRDIGRAISRHFGEEAAGPAPGAVPSSPARTPRSRV